MQILQFKHLDLIQLSLTLEVKITALNCTGILEYS